MYVPPPLLAVEIFGDGSPITIGLAMGIGTLFYVYGRSQGKQDKLAEDQAKTQKALEAESEARKQALEEVRKEFTRLLEQRAEAAAKEREGQARRITELELARAGSDIVQKIVLEQLAKIDGKLDRIVETENQNARRRAADQAA